MEITGLDITLRRIQAIEERFNQLANPVQQFKPEKDTDFQKILDANISQSTAMQKTPFGDKIFSSLNSQKVEPSKFDGLIESYAQKNDLDPDFVKAVIKQESGFQPEVTSHCGAMGLMQLMPATADSLGVKNAFNPEENIAGGTRYLRNMLDKFDGNKELALAAYNAGPGAVQRHGGIPPYNETQNYVKSVLSHYNKYKTGGQN